ncbi:MAG: SpvB/TcaC N-terminal domain-containing protein, partial [Polyangia bacterium]
MRLPLIARSASLLALLAALAPSPAHAVGVPLPGAATPQTVKLPDGPASVRGLADHASVDIFNAQISYSVPIELPHAVDGFAPTVSLGYSGALGNGPLGIGWSLTSPLIRRSERKGVPSFTAADELDLIGIADGRLVA